jgi:hypothetical protein
MKPQAVRRSPRYLMLRNWWRGFHLATQADLVLIGLGLTAWWALSIFGPELFR